MRYLIFVCILNILPNLRLLLSSFDTIFEGIELTKCGAEDSHRFSGDGICKLFFAFPPAPVLPLVLPSDVDGSLT